MTLYKQLTLVILAIFSVLLLVLSGSDLSRIERMQQVQLQNTALDTARTLAIVIGNLSSAQDPQALDRLIDEVIDSGYYSSIEYVAENGSEIRRTSEQSAVRGVPGWFMHNFPLQSARVSTQVTSNDSRLGQLSVEVHPAYAYHGFYDALMSALLWVAASLAGCLLALWLILRHLMQPLHRVRQQADDIRNNLFVQKEYLPPTTELRSIVEAMNLMISRVHGIFNEQERTLNRYQQLLYRDRITNLGNRRYLLEQLQQSISEQSDLYNCMAIIKIVAYEQLREQQGYEAANRLVRMLADLLRKTHAGHSADRVSRFNEDEFAFLSTAGEEAAVELVGALFESFRQRIEDNQELSAVTLVAGICNLPSDAEIGESLARIDYCLSQAETRGPFAIEQQVAANLDLPQGKMQWRGWLESALASQQFFLVGQMAISNQRIPIQRELFVRTRNDQNQVVPAAAFMPMAASLGMSLEIDREVFRLIRANETLDHSIPLAVNLSAAFFEFAEAHEEFDQLLQDCERRGTRLCIEASHHVLNRYPAMCSRVSDRVRQHRHKFGVDNLDLGQSLQLLQGGQFDYVKINAHALYEMIDGEMTAGYQALRTISDTLDIRVIAVAVDSKEVYDALRKLEIENMQGDFLAAPEILDGRDQLSAAVR